MIHIEQITPQLTWQLRRDVLYPGSYLHDMEMDEDLQGYHFGAFTATQLIGVVSLFPNGESWQFRKFAIDPAFQGQGIGRQLLDHITLFAKSEGAKHLWCNARLSAIGFYNKSGFTQTGQTFSKSGIDYEILEKDL
ncbi:GNAT family N-acetyltransferase [Mucilaginibacter sp. PPCGB 2223]|uniref:GNAT family N-acetyltransferase n=1 Tax=Mucilaginibacter sp. PPCGB 2223 TaxID=1886027 RepID=UPI00082693FB|nr:GNAT family N-acetyltransferase [Mucilaginibacter sp. PPCGB 2223]OCX51743.1 GNAT family N-acetyltransferase [Mucilaginibacter sp. PPCGB 2223]